jgi:acyl-CoA dehydrogenase
MNRSLISVHRFTIVMGESFGFLKNPLTDLSEEEKLFRESVVDFCSKNITPNWERFDEESGRHPVLRPDLYSKLGEQGLLALTCKTSNGGQGGSQTMATIAVEELGYADPSVATAVYTLLNIGWPYMLDIYGEQSLANEVIGRVAKGEAFFGIASTEAQGGSDLAGLKTKLTRKDNGYLISGTKTYISGVNEVFNLGCGGGWFLLGRSGGEGHRGLSAVAVLPKWDGYTSPGTTHSILTGMGRHGLSTGSITFEDFHVSRRNLIGEEGRGFYTAMEGFNGARILVAAACVGASRWLLERGAEWINSREAFGRKLSDYQGISFRFAELYGKLEASRMMVYRAARLYDKIYLERRPGYSKTDLNGPVAMAKVWAPETAVEIAQEVMKWHGALSFMSEHPVHRSFLGLLSYIIGAEGAQNVMKSFLARELLERR